MVKKIMILLLIVFSFQTAWGKPSFILQSIDFLKQCYKIQNNKSTGSDLAKCALKQINTLPNPRNYRLHLKKSAPHQLTLYIFDPKGYQMICVFYAFATLSVKECKTGYTNRLTGGENMSMTPPGE